MLALLFFMSPGKSDVTQTSMLHCCETQNTCMLVFSDFTYVSCKVEMEFKVPNGHKEE